MTPDAQAPEERNEIVGRQDVKRIVRAMLEEYGLIVPVLTTKELMVRLDEMLVAQPFVPFRLRCGKSDFEIKEPAQCRFNCRGSVEIRLGDGELTILNNDHVNLVEPLASVQEQPQGL